MNDHDFDINGPALIDAFIKAQAKATGDKKTLKIARIFEKYGVSLMDGMAMTLELIAAIQEEQK